MGQLQMPAGYQGDESRNDDTPTNETPRPLQLNTTLDYSPIGEPNVLDSDSPNRFGGHGGHDAERSAADDLSSFDFHPGFQAAGSETQQQGYHQTGQHLQGGYGRFEHDDDSPVDVPQALNGGGGLRVANRSSGDSDDWGAEAIRHLGLRNVS
jgi:hypothetical protein